MVIDKEQLIGFMLEYSRHLQEDLEVFKKTSSLLLVDGASPPLDKSEHFEVIMQLVNYWKLNIKLVQNDLQGLISPSDLSRCLEYIRSRAIDFAKAQGLLETEGDRKKINEYWDLLISDSRQGKVLLK